MPLSGIGRFGAAEVSGDTLVGAVTKTIWSFRLRISLYGEHAFRVLVYLAERNGERCTVGDISAAYRVSRTTSDTWCSTWEGPISSGPIAAGGAASSSGGLRRRSNSARCSGRSSAILGAGDFDPLAPIAREALDAFLAVLDRYTLEDVLREHRPPFA